MRLPAIILLLAIISQVSASAEEIKTYRVSVQVSGPGSSASGSLAADEGRRGKIIIASGPAGKAMGISISGMAEGSRNVELIDDKSRKFLSGEEALAATIYFKAVSAPDNKVRIVGLLNQKTRIDGGEFPTFDYVEKQLDFTVRSNGEDVYILDLETPSYSVKVGLTVTEIGITDAEPARAPRTAEISAEYSLFNKTDNRYELGASECRFRLSYGSGDNASTCTKKVFFPGDGENGLLYMVRIRIEDIEWLDNDRVTFTLSVNRLCGDAAGYVESDDGLRATFNTARMRRQEKTLTGSVGDVYEITLDEFTGSGLPFRASESIRLTF